MNNSVLVLVHPGYAGNRQLTPDRYGGYGDYLSRLKDAVWTQTSIIFLYKRDKLPFELPSDAEVIRDHDRGYHTKELVSRLKERRVDRIDVCGEFLWWYIGDDIKDMEFAKEVLLSGDVAIDGCVKTIYKELKGEFPVEIRRELCYPIVGPSRSSLNCTSQ